MSTIILIYCLSIMTHLDVAVIIPSRMGSTRLANKPLKMIGELSMIEHVVKQVQKTNLPNIYVATDSEEIRDKIAYLGARCIMTDSDCPTGTDRVYAAYTKLPIINDLKYVINVQGDMPFVNPTIITDTIDHLKQGLHDIMTPVIKVGKDIAQSPSNVKAVTDLNGRVLYFSRSLIPHDGTEFLYHVGIYGFKVGSLAKFATLKQTQLGLNENQEQLKALQNGMSIGTFLTTDIPISVDTQQDLDKARDFYHNSVLYL